MRYKKIFLFPYFLLLTFFVAGQSPVIDLDVPTGIDDAFYAMIHRSDGQYYGLGRSGLYSSESGMSWKACDSYLKFDYAISADSFFVTSSWDAGIYFANNCDTSLVYPTYYDFYIFNAGEPSQIVKVYEQHPYSMMRVNNKGHVLQPYTNSHYNYYPSGTYGSSSKGILEVNSSGETRIFGVSKGEFWVEWGDAKVVLSDSLYFYYTDSMMVKPSPDISMTGNAGFGATDTSYFVVCTDGKSYCTYNQGDTWVSGNISLPFPIREYFYRDGIHVIMDKKNNVYFSKDFIDFQKVAEGKVYFTNDEIWNPGHRPDELHVSSDEGQSWDTIYTDGTNRNPSVIHIYNDTVYAVINGDVFQQQCGNHFELCLDKPFLTYYVKVVAGEVVFTALGNKGLLRYNESTSQLDTLFQDFSFYYSQLFTEGNNVFFIHDDSLYLSSDKGMNWEQVAIEFPIRSIGMVGDTLVAVSGVGENCHLYYSLDRGVVWDELTVPNIVFKSFEVPALSVLNNTFFISFDKLYGYADVTQLPNIVHDMFGEPEQIVAFPLRNGLAIQNLKENEFFYYQADTDSIVPINLGDISVKNMLPSSMGHTVFVHLKDSRLLTTNDYFFGLADTLVVEEIASCDSIIVNGKDYFVSGEYLKPKVDWCSQDTILRLAIAEPVIENDTTVYVSEGDWVAGVFISQDTMFRDTLVAVSGCDSLVNNYSVWVVVSTESPVQAEISIRPNPVGDKLMVDLKGFPADWVRVVDVSGHILISSVNNRSDIFVLDLQELDAGSYFLILGNAISSRKEVICFQKL